jgi:adenosine kinase
MRIAVTGSIATDHLMTFEGRFADLLISEHLERISLSFLAGGLTIHRGGVGANIALGLGRLGLSPMLVGAAGTDFAEYRSELEGEGVDCSGVRVSAGQYTARFICTTDIDQNQIATFYPGAMSEAREISLSRLGRFDLVLIGADDPQAMLRHTDECRASGFAFAADPSQQVALMDGASIRQLVDGAAYLFTNAYERVLLCEKTGWSERDVLNRVGHWITTYGRDGARIERLGAPTVRIAAVPAAEEVDPTGVGDGFRVGVLAGFTWSLPLDLAAQVGCAIATKVLAVSGPQGYRLDPAALLADLSRAYGTRAAAEVEPHLLHITPRLCRDRAADPWRGRPRAAQVSHRRQLGRRLPEGGHRAVPLPARKRGPATSRRSGR